METQFYYLLGEKMKGKQFTFPVYEAEKFRVRRHQQPPVAGEEEQQK